MNLGKNAEIARKMEQDVKVSYPKHDMSQVYIPSKQSVPNSNDSQIR